MDLAENRFRKTWERFLEVLKVDCHGKRLRDATIVLQTRVFSFVIKKR